MKRVLAALLLVMLPVAGIIGYSVSRREQAYRHHLEVGEAAMGRDDTFAAIEAFSVAIALKDDAMAGYLRRGEAYRRRNELESAVRDLRRAVEIDPNTPRPFEVLGDVNYALRRFDRAAENYQRYAALDDRSPRVLYKLGLAFYANAQPAAAETALRKVIALDDGFAEAYYLLGLALRDLQKQPEALAALKRAFERDPGLVQAREELANYYGRLGRAGDRIAQLEALRVLDPHPGREVALGLAYARSGQTEEAVLALGRAAERYPEHLYTYVALGRVWLEIAETRRDRVALTKALGALEGAAASDNGSEALMLYGRALLLAGDTDNAQEMLQQATERVPADPLAFYHLADAAERRGQHSVARSALLDYHALEGDDPDPRRRAAIATRIANSSVRAGDHATAVTWYLRAADAMPPDADLLVRLATAQADTGDAAAAKATIAKALEKEPASRAARALDRRLGPALPPR